jgi:hypothetical protein
MTSRSRPYSNQDQSVGDDHGEHGEQELVERHQQDVVLLPLRNHLVLDGVDHLRINHAGRESGHGDAGGVCE